MTSKLNKTIFMSGVAALAIAAATQGANASGFLLREQSADAVGNATAGVAAGSGGLGSVFWNPAVLTRYQGLQTYSAFTGILPSARNQGTAGTYAGFELDSGNIASGAVLPASVYSYQLSDQFWVGASISTPFGLETRNPVVYAGSPFGIHSKINSVNLNPSVAYKVNDWLSVALGLQVQYLKALQTQGVPTGAGPVAGGIATLKADGWGAGATAGVLITPWAGTDIGIGYRSAVKTGIDGRFTDPGILGFNASLNVETPSVLTFGLRQRINAQFDLLAGFEWDHWRLGAIPLINSANGTPINLGAGNITVPFNYNDSYMFSLGGEYKWDQRWTLRGGVAYEKVPINDANRRPTLPEADRVWASVGFSYKLAESYLLDVGYSHIFVKNASLNVATGPGGAITYAANTSASADLLSVALTHRFGAPAASVLVTKY